jgi:hypothetical protein
MPFPLLALGALAGAVARSGAAKVAEKAVEKVVTTMAKNTLPVLMSTQQNGKPAPSPEQRIAQPVDVAVALAADTALQSV